MRRVILVLSLLLPSVAAAQSGPALPSSCVTGELFTVTSFTPPLDLRCASTNVWAIVVGTKTVTGISNGIFTGVLTVTVPNIASGALIEVILSGSLGAGGAVGAFEATTGRTVLIAVTRTPGAATVATLATVMNATSARVAGAATIAQATQISAISGPVGGVQTFALEYRISRGSGASTNHIASLISRVTGPAPIGISVQ